MCQHEVATNGWTSTPANAGAIFADQPFINKPDELSLNDIKFPFDDPVVSKTLKYAKEVLHPETFNHSMRVFFYGMAITKQQFPGRYAALNPVTWALTCLLHDLGTAEENLTATRISFDIYGGIKALHVLKDFGATTDQAEAAAETIIRHEDMGVDGTITYIGQLIQLATTYDNTDQRNLPTNQMVCLFAGVIRKEETIKPWCHSTHLVDFDNETEANALMKQ
ncbi:cyanamide hydratase [Penicillium cinerascens]|uniref:Cyanamide hydratase n=1 Tax=Penicillium cinerascens TaxID=70096 RepID=A0A9W9TE99_9EURO|nr:cyanamide hydratase [Penicillium cinerascens]KAJ5219483.1 cyanamide hydratase [Penicillium cinerascens]